MYRELLDERARLSARLPRAELHLFDTGHFALEEKSGEIARLTLRFLKKSTKR